MDKKPKNIAFFGDSLTHGVPGFSYFDILKEKLPQHKLFNLGKGGDTVISLFHRLVSLNLDFPMDIAFLWIGVNDVFVKTSPISPVIKRLRRQPWAKNHQEFQVYYVKILEYLCDKFTIIYTIPPLFIGEDRENPWNRELNTLSSIIAAMTNRCDNVEYTDLRQVFFSQLPSENISPYVPKSFLRILWDSFSLKTPKETEQKVNQRGLRFTLDGIHLNQTGAELAATIFLEKINKFSAS
jgi:lysophospholipase L1-like esterase